VARLSIAAVSADASGYARRVIASSCSSLKAIGIGMSHKITPSHVSATKTALAVQLKQVLINFSQSQRDCIFWTTDPALESVSCLQSLLALWWMPLCGVGVRYILPSSTD
jgi:hypothetical protein